MAVVGMDTQVLLHCALMCLYAASNVKPVVSTPACKWNQITRTNGSLTSCWKCPSCPEGLGLTPQCASYVTYDVTIQCVACVADVNYSDLNDISSCKPCTICDTNEETLRPCTVTTNALCGKCKKGYYREITGDCWPCTHCCPNSTRDVVSDCIHQGLPAEQSCRLDFNTAKCAHSSPTPHHTSRQTNLVPLSDVNKKSSDKNNTVIVLGSPSSYKTYFYLVCSGLGITGTVIIIVIAIFIFKCYLQNVRHRKTHVGVLEKGNVPPHPQPIALYQRVNEHSVTFDNVTSQNETVI